MSSFPPFDFRNSRTVFNFTQDDSFFRGLKGPVGSGKSYACAAEVFLRALRVPADANGIRKSRFVVVRNSYPELRTTTLKTWQDLFPPNIFGPVKMSPPYTHHIKIDDLDMEVIFMALDTVADVKKLLSLELTGAWLNEARELPFDVVNGLSARVGRYPGVVKGQDPWRGIWADTNPMDSDHWWYRLAEKETPATYKFFDQPGAMIECKSGQPGAVFGGGRYWVENPLAENIPNLVDGYYRQQLAAKKLDWLQCYVGGQYVFVKEGEPVWNEYEDGIMCKGELKVDPRLPITVGIDFGLTPAACFGQRQQNGQWFVLSELTTERMALEPFTDELKYHIQQRYSGHRVKFWGDPAGMSGDTIYETNCFDHMRSKGFDIQPAGSNTFMIRREAGAAPMLRGFRGEPGLFVDSRCERLRKSLSGGFYFKREQIGGGGERFRSVPDKKSMYSHIGDAYGYMMMGGGEHRELVVGKAQTGGNRVVAFNWNPLR